MNAKQIMEVTEPYVSTVCYCPSTEITLGTCMCIILYGLLEIADAIRSLRPTNYSGVK